MAAIYPTSAQLAAMRGYWLAQPYGAMPPELDRGLPACRCVIAEYMDGSTPPRHEADCLNGAAHRIALRDWLAAAEPDPDAADRDESERTYADAEYGCGDACR